MTEPDLVITIMHESDAHYAQLQAKQLSTHLGFSQADSSMIATVVSELAHNIFFHAKTGKIVLHAFYRFQKTAIEIIAEDEGPGIPDITKSLQEGYTTQNTLGLGLPGVKRMVDEFIFDSERECGTKIVVRKWVLHNAT